MPIAPHVLQISGVDCTLAVIDVRGEETLGGLYRQPERIDSHLAGIDFTEPVQVMTLPKGTLVNQFQIPGQRVGGYLAPLNTTGDTLGIDTMGRVPSLFSTTADVQVLRSTAADILDWRGSGSIFQGGGIQYFTLDNFDFLRTPNQ